MRSRPSDRIDIEHGALQALVSLFGINGQKNTPSETLSEPFSEGGEYNESTTGETLPEGLTGALNGTGEETPCKPLVAAAQKRNERQKKLREIYSRYQDNTIRSDELRKEILKGVREGADIFRLFLMAAEAMSRMTDDPAFLTQIKTDLQSIYGQGLNLKAPLEIERQEAHERLQKLEGAAHEEREAGDLERIRAAVTAHRALIEKLDRAISEAS